MIQIANVPYQRIYKFSYMSDAILLKIILYGLSLLLPFFLVFSTNSKHTLNLSIDFYLSFTDSITAGPKLVYDYNYHLIIETSSSVYTYSSLYKVPALRALSFSYENNDNQLTHTFTLNWPKPVDEKVLKVGLAVFMKYSTGTVTDGYGIVYGEGSGYDVADLNVVGTVGVATGMNAAQSPPTTNILAQNGYSLGATMLALQQNYSSYLKFSTEYLSNNMRTNLLKFSLKLKAPTIAVQETNASVLGQLVWSFTQYFPIAVVFWTVSTWVLGFLLKEGIVKRAVIDDKF